MQANKVEQWVWVLLYGGLLTLVLGLAVEGNAGAQDGGLALAWALIGAGAVAAAVGMALIYVRSRMKP